MLKSGIGGGSMTIACPQENEEASKSWGLIANHAYSVLDTGGGPHTGWSGGRSFLRLRNPHGEGEWKGDWSDLSPLWDSHPEIKRRLITQRGYEADGDDGAFWMELSDISTWFVDPSWCWFSPHLHSKRLQGAWSGDSAGGNHSRRTWGNNPHYKLDVHHRGTFLFKVSCTDRGFCTDAVESHLVGMNLLHAETVQGLVEYPVEFPESEEGRAQEHLIRTTLDPGTYWIVPDCFTVGVQGDFVLHATSPTPFRLVHAPKSDFVVTHTVHGVVDEPYGHPDEVDGCPRMVLTTQQPCKITATMQVDERDPRVVADAAAGPHVPNKDRLAIQLHLCEGQAGHGRLRNSLAESRYLMSDSVAITVQVDAPGTFTLVPKPVLPRGGAPQPLRVAVTVECTDLRCRLE
jgi:hypothetical protein